MGNEKNGFETLKDQLEMYNEAIKVAREEGDDASRELFARLLKDEEGHVDWLEAQLQRSDPEDLGRRSKLPDWDQILDKGRFGHTDYGTEPIGSTA